MADGLDCDRSPRITVGLRPELLTLLDNQGVPPGGSGGNFGEFSSDRVCSHAPASLTTSTRVLSSVMAFLDLRDSLSGESAALSTEDATLQEKELRRSVASIPQQPGCLLRALTIILEGAIVLVQC